MTTKAIELLLGAIVLTKEGNSPFRWDTLRIYDTDGGNVWIAETTDEHGAIRTALQKAVEFLSEAD